MRKMSNAAWICGDPGMQYDTTINDWHRASNNVAHQRVESVLGIHVHSMTRPANLASLNLM